MSRIREAILQNSGESEGKYWAVSKGGETRLDVRFSSGARTSLQYHSIQKINFYKEGSDEGDDLLALDLTGVSLFEIIGKNLLQVYEALNRQSARYVAASTSETDREDENGVIIRTIREFTADEMMVQGAEPSEVQENDQAAIEAFMDALSEEEIGSLVDEAYRIARENLDSLIDEKSEEGERARWEAVASLVRKRLHS